MAKSGSATVTGDMNSLLAELQQLHKVSYRLLFVYIAMRDIVCVHGSYINYLYV